MINKRGILGIAHMSEVDMKVAARLIALELSFEDCNKLIDALREMADQVGIARTDEYERKNGL
jgi:hypothetical protein